MSGGADSFDAGVPDRETGERGASPRPPSEDPSLRLFWARAGIATAILLARHRSAAVALDHLQEIRGDPGALPPDLRDALGLAEELLAGGQTDEAIQLLHPFAIWS